MATWPETLPNPNVADYALEVPDATARTDMEGGPARVRRRSSSVPDKIQLRWRFDDAQMATFRNFWKNEWALGAAFVLLPLKDGYSSEIVLKACRPVPASYKAPMLSKVAWQVEMTVEVRDA